MESEQTDTTEEIDRLQRGIVDGLVAHAPAGWLRVGCRAEVTSASVITETWAAMPDGTRTRFSARSGRDVRRLRDLQAAPGTGAWFTLDVVVQEDGRWEMNEDVGDPPDAGPVTCASQVARFPRDPEHVPAWLEERLRQAVVDLAPDLGALDAPAESVVVQEDYAPGGAQGSRSDPPLPDDVQVAGRRARCERLVEVFARCGIEAEISVETTGDGRGGRVVRNVSVDLVDDPAHLTILVDDDSAFLVGDREAETDDVTYREAYRRVRRAHEVLQVATGWRPVLPGAIGEDVLNHAGLDDATVALRASTRRAIDPSSPEDVDAARRRASGCPACGWFVAGQDGGPGSGQACPSCGRIGHHDGGAPAVEPAATWRAWWVLDGLPWRGVAASRPVAWDPVDQLERYVRAGAAPSR